MTAFHLYLGIVFLSCIIYVIYECMIHDRKIFYNWKERKKKDKKWEFPPHDTLQ
jgi:hypothetical protein